ncbi:nucleolar protein 10 (nucleomorph) [Cryptomonas paramecium]|uniref:Nucleolar protein 10 n=1 Tax=Cryptomonas paramaecium TaxID=2898 RepID=F2HHP0_9CRYP|nr:nucleolar protein 10 [Cryptomonas paramecium]AEA38836.1 nucleolar protein 10 [Cryptomonas paramecium]|mmetsp:Transcript_5583/g.17814  ORF Transcript_5583/g.17814 Transcript_5583/m.17814 type:complete len:350 (-) Transcript_5583:5632-6681(-)
MSKYSAIKLSVDFNFPSVIKKTQLTQDGSFLISYGEYPPQIRCFDLNSLSLKFQRTVDHEVKDFCVLSRNWEKFVLLKSNKCLEFHCKKGYYYQIKIPKISNFLFFDKYNNILYIFSTENEIFKFDINQGKFTKSIKSSFAHPITSATEAFSNCLIGTGNSKSIVEIWDLRINKFSINKINNQIYIRKKTFNGISSLQFCKENINRIYSGFFSNEILIQDMRMTKPLILKKFKKKGTVLSLQKIEKKELVLCANEKTIKIWNERNGKTIITIKPKKQINHIYRENASGVIFISMMTSNIGCMYVSLLGSTPSWCYITNRNNNKIIRNAFQSNEFFKQNFRKDHDLSFYQ